MEIDFMGLNSPKSKLEQESSKISHIQTVGEVEVSLSLSRSSSSLNFTEKKKWESSASEKLISASSTVYRLAPYNTEQPSPVLVAPPSFRRRAACGFPYDLNEAAADNLRTMSQVSAEPLTMLYPTCPYVFTEPQRPNNTVYISGNASTGLSTPGGYTPTVAMARRATLARFLEKRLHRMNQARGSHIMGRPSPLTLQTALKQKNHLKNNILIP